MIAILWTYDVRPEAVEAFERAYGAAGDRAVLFRRAEAIKAPSSSAAQATPASP